MATGNGDLLAGEICVREYSSALCHEPSHCRRRQANQYCVRIGEKRSSWEFYLSGVISCLTFLYGVVFYRVVFLKV